MTSGQSRTFINRSLTVPAGGQIALYDENESGELLYAFIVVHGANGQNLQVLFQLDGQPGPDDGRFTIDNLGTWGIDEQIQGRFWLTKWDAVANRWTIFYSNNNVMERYRKNLKLIVFNPTVGALTIERVEIKRMNVCSVNEGFSGKGNKDGE